MSDLFSAIFLRDLSLGWRITAVVVNGACLLVIVCAAWFVVPAVARGTWEWIHATFAPDETQTVSDDDPQLAEIQRRDDVVLNDIKRRQDAQAAAQRAYLAQRSLNTPAAKGFARSTVVDLEERRRLNAVAVGRERVQ